MGEEKTYRVLIVDDAPFMRQMLKDILSTGPFEVVDEAGDGVAAIEKFKEHEPDLVTMDLVMPYKSGIEATKEILKVKSDAVVVVCSALDQESMRLEALAAGAQDFVVKPFGEADEVLRVMYSALGHQQ